MTHKEEKKRSLEIFKELVEFYCKYFGWVTEDKPIVEIENREFGGIQIRITNLEGHRMKYIYKICEAFPNLQVVINGYNEDEDILELIIQ